MRRFIVTFAAVAALAGLGAAAWPGAETSGAAAPSIDLFKKLEGEWCRVGPDGKASEKTGTSFRVTAGGTAVLEIMSGGEPTEMLTVFHTDQKKLVLTHYCMLGNQPRMEAAPGPDEKTVLFRFTGCGNLADEKETHMHEASYTFLGEDRFKTAWTMYVGGKPAETHEFTYERKKKK